MQMHKKIDKYTVFIGNENTALKYHHNNIHCVMKATWFSEALVSYHITVWYHSTEDHSLNIHM